MGQRDTITESSCIKEALSPTIPSPSLVKCPRVDRPSRVTGLMDVAVVDSAAPTEEITVKTQ